MSYDHVKLAGVCNIHTVLERSSHSLSFKCTGFSITMYLPTVQISIFKYASLL